MLGQRGHSKLETPTRVKTLVLGLGNILMGDEGIGVPHRPGS